MVFLSWQNFCQLHKMGTSKYPHISPYIIYQYVYIYIIYIYHIYIYHISPFKCLWFDAIFTALKKTTFLTIRVASRWCFSLLGALAEQHSGRWKSTPSGDEQHPHLCGSDGTHWSPIGAQPAQVDFCHKNLAYVGNMGFSQEKKCGIT